MGVGAQTWVSGRDFGDSRSRHFQAPGTRCASRGDSLFPRRFAPALYGNHCVVRKGLAVAPAKLNFKTWSK